MYHPAQLTLKKKLEIKMNVVIDMPRGILKTKSDSVIRKHIYFGQTEEKMDFTLDRMFYGDE